MIGSLLSLMLAFLLWASAHVANQSREAQDLREADEWPAILAETAP